MPRIPSHLNVSASQDLLGPATPTTAASNYSHIPPYAASEESSIAPATVINSNLNNEPTSIHQRIINTFKSFLSSIINFFKGLFGSDASANLSSNQTPDFSENALLGLAECNDDLKPLIPFIQLHLSVTQKDVINQMLPHLAEGSINPIHYSRRSEIEQVHPLRYLSHVFEDSNRRSLYDKLLASDFGFPKNKVKKGFIEGFASSFSKAKQEGKLSSEIVSGFLFQFKMDSENKEKTRATLLDFIEKSDWPSLMAEMRGLYDSTQLVSLTEILAENQKSHPELREYLTPEQALKLKKNLLEIEAHARKQTRIQHNIVNRKYMNRWKKIVSYNPFFILAEIKKSAELRIIVDYIFRSQNINKKPIEGSKYPPHLSLSSKIGESILKHLSQRGNNLDPSQTDVYDYLGFKTEELFSLIKEEEWEKIVRIALELT